MAKREEIQEWITNLLYTEMEQLRPTHASAWAKDMTDKILSHLNTEGVMISVEQELPSNLEVRLHLANGVLLGADALDEAGYVAVESLIEEGSNGND